MTRAAPGDVRGQGRRGVVDLGQRRRHRGALVERAAAGEQLVGDDAERVQVGRAGGGLTECLLWREVVRGADPRRSGSVRSRPPRGLCRSR